MKWSKRVTSADEAESRRGSPPRPLVVAALLAIAIGVVYGRALHAPFIFDDNPTIKTNKSIVSLWPPVGSALHPGPLNPVQGLPTAGRPLVNYSLAWNYHFGGFNPTGFHVVNIAFHFLSSLLLWAIVRRTLRLSYFVDRFAASAGWLATAVALLWALHPLQTEAVIYVTQRTELMAAFFYLGTLYCSLRYWNCRSVPEVEISPNRCNDIPATRAGALWFILAVIACICGMASKEVMASAPLVVLLFERTFVAGSLANGLRRSWPLYVGLASTWILLLLLNLGNPRGESAGFGLGVSASEWWFTQAKILALYAKLTIWPSPLLIHYHLEYLSTFAEAWIYVVPVVLAAIATLSLLWRNHPIGFLGTFVFAILAPSTVVPILYEMAAERRMYLPLAAVMALVVVGGNSLAQAGRRRLISRTQVRSGPVTRALPVAVPVIVLTLAYGIASGKRAAAYYDEVQLWQQIVELQPVNYIARHNLSDLLTKAGRLPEAIEQAETAIRLKPDFTLAVINLGTAHAKSGRYQEAVDAYQRALVLQPDNTLALNNLGAALNHLGRFPESIETLRHSLRLGPQTADTHANLAFALSKAGRLEEAVAELETTRSLMPDDPVVLNNLGTVLTKLGRAGEAVEPLKHALRILPDYTDAHNNLGIAYVRTAQIPQAIGEFRRVVELNPNDFSTRYNLIKVLAATGRSEEAVASAHEAIEFARTAGQAATAEQIGEWLKNYEREHAP